MSYWFFSLHVAASVWVNELMKTVPTCVGSECHLAGELCCLHFGGAEFHFFLEICLHDSFLCFFLALPGKSKDDA